MPRWICIPFLQQQSLDKLRRGQRYLSIVKFTESLVCFPAVDFVPYYSDIVLFLIPIRHHCKDISNFSFISIMSISWKPHYNCRVCFFHIEIVYVINKLLIILHEFKFVQISILDISTGKRKCIYRIFIITVFRQIMHEDIYRCKALLTIDYKIRIGIFGMSYYCNGLKAIVWFMAFIITIPFCLQRFYKIQQVIKKFLYLTWFPTISTLVRRYNEMHF